MNAPIPAATLDAPEFRIIKIGDLSPSPTNPRSRRGFDAVSLNELAETMRPPVGVIEPLVVRVMRVKLQSTKKVDAWPFPTPGKKPEENAEADSVEKVTHYEIVCGERRWRAAQIAGLDSLPVLVRTLTDFEVLRLQLIENEKRKDLDALEEAEGYEKLMQQKDADGNPYTAEALAKLQGVSKGTIYARLKLLALCPDARNAFFDGKIDASTALLIARIPVEKLQLQALKDVTAEADWSNQLMAKGDKMSYRRAREILQDKYMLDLDRAPFDTQDAALLPKAGNCTACPKRTGNAPDLFDDVKDENVCTDPVCFGMKKAAHVLKLQKEAENTGAEFIGTKKAKKLIGNQYSDAATQLRDHGYAPLDTLVPGDAKKRTLGQLLEENNLMKPTLVSGKPVVQKTVVANPHRDGQMIETVNIEAATKALREAGFEITLKGKDTAPAKDNAAAEKGKAKLKLAVERETAYRQHLFTTLRASIKASTEPGNSAKPGLYALLAELALNEFYDFVGEDDLAKLMRLYQPDIVIEAGKEVEAWNEFMKLVPDFTPQQHFMLLFDVRMLEETDVSEWSIRNGVATPKIMTRIAEAEGIDPVKLRADLADAEKAAKATKKPEAKKPAAKAKPAEKKAAAPTAKKPAAEPAKPAAPAAKRVADWPFPTPGVKPSETSSTPTPAAQAQDSGAKTKATPEKPVPAKAGTKRKAAAAA